MERRREGQREDGGVGEWGAGEQESGQGWWGCVGVMGRRAEEGVGGGAGCVR